MAKKRGGNYKRHWSQKKTGKTQNGEQKSMREMKKRMKSSGR